MHNVVSNLKFFASFHPKNYTVEVQQTNFAIGLFQMFVTVLGFYLASKCERKEYFYLLKIQTDNDKLTL